MTAPLLPRLGLEAAAVHAGNPLCVERKGFPRDMPTLAARQHVFAMLSRAKIVDKHEVMHFFVAFS
jgi:hypothetical protein